MRKSNKTIALIVAAGKGERTGFAIPKQYIKIGGSTLLRRSILAFAEHPGVDHVRVVIRKGDEAFYQESKEGIKVLTPVYGGKTRQESVRLGLESLKNMNPVKVLIHDAARPFVSAEIIENTIRALDSNSAVIPVIPFSDTVKKIAKDDVAGTIEKSSLAAAQTPQGFDYKTILAAHKKAEKLKLTDDAAVAEHSGIKVKTVRGASDNFKITTEEDLERVRKIHDSEKIICTGLGFDVHAFKTAKSKNQRIKLGGVAIPYPRGLEGHSDADVVLHAIVDGILGAVGEGDIGEHFPPTDPKWRNADSLIFLRHAHKIAKDKNAKIQHIDVVVICEEPKITPHKQAMAKNISKVLEISAGMVNIKATTTEGLGFTGRKEGIAAKAIVTVARERCYVRNRRTKF